MNLSDLKQLYRSRLNAYFSDSELKQIVKSVVSKKLNINNTDYLLLGNDSFQPNEEQYFLDTCNKLESGEPFQYVIGEVYFAGLELLIDQRALIPRPETEELVDWIIKDHKDVSNSLKILDICTGSGCIALGVKNVLSHSEVMGIDYSGDAIRLASENAEKTSLNVRFEKADALSEEAYYSYAKDSFDVWVSNPPYIPKADVGLMEPNVLDYEPHMALFVDDEDPLVFYRAIAMRGMDYLRSGGALYFEVHEELAADVVELMKKTGFVNIEVRKDLQGKDRMIKSIK